jgi:hypothetical protein
MPANTSPVFTLTAQCPTVQVTTGQSTTDNPSTNVATVLTAGANGTRVDRVVATSNGTSVAALLNLYINDGSVNRLIKQLPVTAITGSTTVQTFTTEWVRTDGLPLVVLPTGYSLRATVTVTQTNALNVCAYAGDY